MSDSGVFIHPQAIVEATAIGTGTRIWALAHVCKGAALGADCNIGEGCYIEAGSRIGDRVTVKNGAMIWEGVTIGNDVFVGPGVVFTNDLRPRSPRSDAVRDKYLSSGWRASTSVGRGASIGANCTISCGLSIGEFAMIGAGAVVTTDIPAYVLAFGNPARVRGYVCSCGEKLPSFRGGISRCATCSLQYRKAGNGVIASVDAGPAKKAVRVLAVAIAFNEERKLGSVLSRFQPGDVTEIMVVDDGSTDRTAEVARSHGATVVSHGSRGGAGAAIRTAIQYARNGQFDVLVILAGNDKDRPSEIPRLLHPIRDEGFDFVQGSRYLPGGNHGNMPAYRRLATQFAHPLLFSLLTGRRITDSTNGFRALRMPLLDDPRIDLNQKWLNQYELEPYLFFKAIKLGYKVKEVPVTKIYPAKALGYTKMVPVIGWWSILRPLLLLALRMKK